MPICSNCHAEVSGKFCSHCGQPLITKRISLSSIMHEVFHTFTHLDKGYGYTLKELIRRPGSMQRNYLAGTRARHQKPFSYFFINATLCALIFYWINVWVSAIYGSVDNGESYYFKHWFAIAQVLLLPFYALTSWLVWKLMIRSKYNYGEMIVLVLYSAGTFMLFLCVIILAKLIWPSINTRYIEVPLLFTYNIITNLNFFHKSKWPAILAGTAITFGINYFVSGSIGDLVSRAMKE